MAVPLYVVFTTLIEDYADVVDTTVTAVGDYVRSKVPTAKITWGFDNNIFGDGTKASLVTAVGNYITAHGDEPAIGAGFPTRDLTEAQWKTYIDTVVSGIQSNYTLPTYSACSWLWNVPSLEYMATKGLQIVQGQAWSQALVDGYSGAGAIPYPYFASKRHSLVPASSTADNTGIVMLDTNTPDLVGNLWDRARYTIHPADPPQYGANNATAISAQYIANPGANPFVLLLMYLEVRWPQNDATIKANYQGWVDWMAANHPEAQWLTMKEFRDIFAAAYPDNAGLSYKFIFTGLGENQGGGPTDRPSDSNLRHYWYFDRDGRACVQENISGGTYTLIDCLRYTSPDIAEPIGQANDLSLRQGLNWKYDDPRQGFALADVGTVKRLQAAWPSIPPIV